MKIKSSNLFFFFLTVAVITAIIYPKDKYEEDFTTYSVYYEVIYMIDEVFRAETTDCEQWDITISLDYIEYLPEGEILYKQETEDCWILIMKATTDEIGLLYRQIESVHNEIMI